MKSQYQWLKEEQARLRKQGKGSWRDDLSKLAVLGEGAGNSQFVGNTGYGEDGRLQPSMPTQVVQTAQGPRMLHEGENAIRNADGSVTIVPAGPSQSQLLQIQQRTGIPGMQGGGTYDPGRPETWKTGNEALAALGKPLSSSPAASTVYTPGSNRGQTGGSASRTSPSYSPTNPTTWSNAANAFSGAKAMGWAPADANLYGTSPRASLPAQGMTPLHDPNVPAELGGQGMAGLLVTPPAPSPSPTATLSVQKQTPLRIGETPPTASLPAQKQTPLRIGETPPTASQPTSQITPQTTTTTEGPPPEPPAPPPTQFGGGGYWGRGMQRLERYAEGRGPYDEQIYNQAMSQFKGEEAATRGSLEQQMAQGGITGREAAAERYMAGLGIGTQETQLMADLRKQQANRAFEAAKGIPGEARAQEQFDFLKQQYGDQTFQRMSADIAAGMTPQQAAQKYGLSEADYNQIKQSVFWTRTMEEKRYGLDEGRFNLLRQEYGDQKLQRLATDIQNGATYNQLLASGMYPDLQLGDYNTMRGSIMWNRDFQERTWQYSRDTETINSLLAAGGPENYAQAATLFSKLYGPNIDFSRLLNTETSNDFAAGMQNLTQYIGSGVSFDDAVVAMRADGTMSKLGMTEEQVGTLYSRMEEASNPVYRAMNSIDDQTLATMFPGVDAATARSTIGRMYLMGVGTFNSTTGQFQVDYGMLSTLFGGQIPGAPGATPTTTESEGWTSFEGTLPEGVEGWTYQRWVGAGRPATYDVWLQNPAGTPQASPPDTGTATFADLYAATNGDLSNTSSDKILPVVEAIRREDESAIERFGIDDSRYLANYDVPVSEQILGMPKQTRTGTDNWIDSNIYGITYDQLRSFVGRVVADGTEAWVIQRVTPSSTGRGGVIVTLRNVNSGETIMRDTVVNQTA